MSYPPSYTAASVVLAIQAELSLPQSEANSTGEQLLALLNSAGIELLLAYPWQQLSRTYNVTLDGVSEEYDLPDDWMYFVDQTQWDVTNSWPLTGPTNPQTWQWLQNGGVGATGPRIRYRVRADKFQVFPATETSDLQMEYISANWVENTLGDTSYRTIQTATNIILLDHYLLQKYTKLKFWEIKGFDTTAFKSDFLRVFWGLTGKDKGAPILSLTGRRGPSLLTTMNVPDTGYGL